MISDAQSLYLQEVLGVSPGSFFSAVQPAPEPVHQELGTVVMTGPLNPEEVALLGKILSSVQLKNFTHIESLGDVSAQKVLVFGGNLTIGRHEFENSVWWSAPALHTMLGSDPVVTENKKLTWALLQQMAKEIQ